MEKLIFEKTQGGDKIIVEAENNIIVLIINPEKENYDLPLNEYEAVKIANFILGNISK